MLYSLPKEEEEGSRPIAPPLTCRYGAPAKLSSNANSLVADENTGDVIHMIWLIKAYDYNQS